MLRSAYRRNEEIFVSEFGSLVNDDDYRDGEYGVLDPEIGITRLERQLDGDDSDSDSSLDLHTPLPYVSSSPSPFFG